MSNREDEQWPWLNQLWYVKSLLYMLIVLVV
jgi:hypothetical protein